MEQLSRLLGPMERICTLLLSLMNVVVESAQSPIMVPVRILLLLQANLDVHPKGVIHCLRHDIILLPQIWGERRSNNASAAKRCAPGMRRIGRHQLCSLNYRP